MSKFFKWNMLVTSFIPLWVSILFLLAWDLLSVRYKSLACFIANNRFALIFAIIIVIIALVSTIAVVVFLRRKGNTNESSGVGIVLSASKSATLVTDFLLTYVMPLIAFDFTALRDIILFAIYFTLIAFLNIRNGNVYTNILFEFFGYKVYSCDVERKISGKQFQYPDSTVISRENLTGIVGQEFSFYDFDNDLYLNLNGKRK